VATRVTMRVVVTTPLMITPSLAFEPEPPPLPGVFLGHNSMHKGYKYLHVPTGRVYLSHDIVFYENKFLFAHPQHPSPIPISETTLLPTMCPNPCTPHDQHVARTILPVLDNVSDPSSPCCASGISDVPLQAH
jgi:hypothetical protein